jgi:16S rRNA (adenine1518-N6/adenine1519-N6)-dimethyltransferase
LGCNEKLFFRVVKTGFNQRRKMLRNSLAALIMEKDTADPLLSRRPEQLAVEDFVRITNFLDTGQ